MPLVRITRFEQRGRFVEASGREEIARSHEANLACRWNVQRISGDRRRARMGGIQTERISNDPDVRAHERCDQYSGNQPGRDPGNPGFPAPSLFSRRAPPRRAHHTGWPGHSNLRGHSLETIESVQQRKRFVAAGVTLDCRREELPGRRPIAAAERRSAGVHELVSFALFLGNRTSRPLDVRTGGQVPAVEEEDPHPYVDSELVLAGEIMVQTGKEKLFDPGVAFPIRRVSRPIRAKRVRHSDNVIAEVSKFRRL